MSSSYEAFSDGVVKTLEVSLFVCVLGRAWLNKLGLLRDSTSMGQPQRRFPEAQNCGGSASEDEGGFGGHTLSVSGPFLSMNVNGSCAGT